LVPGGRLRNYSYIWPITIIENMPMHPNGGLLRTMMCN
jgi:hypothetical protein